MHMLLLPWMVGPTWERGKPQSVLQRIADRPDTKGFGGEGVVHNSMQFRKREEFLFSWASTGQLGRLFALAES
jgi:hypothetical protein